LSKDLGWRVEVVDGITASSERSLAHPVAIAFQTRHEAALLDQQKANTAPKYGRHFIYAVVGVQAEEKRQDRVGARVCLRLKFLDDAHQQRLALHLPLDSNGY
jgi:hypothetical protein